MRITDIETILLTGPCTNDPFLSEVRKRRSAAFIQIHTNAGLIGCGETYAGYFCPELVPGIVEFFKPILVGQTVDDIDELWRRCYHCGNFWARVGLGLIVLNGLEAALWDLKGKQLRQPVCELLGGSRHEKLLAYATGGPSNYPEERLAAKVEHYLQLGFQAVKLGAGTVKEGCFAIAADPGKAAAVEAGKLQFLRDRFGSDLRLMLDGHMGNSPDCTWNLETARAVMDAVEPFGLLFFEEPLHYTDPWGYAELCAGTAVPIAGGECLTGWYEWKIFAERDCFDIGQPDASFTGGLRECMRVAELLQTRNRSIAMHAWGAGGCLMQNIHVGFAAPNTCILEVPPDFGPLHREIIGDSLRFHDGCIYPPDAPGLGITLSDAVKQRYRFVPGSGEFNSVPGKVLRD